MSKELNIIVSTGGTGGHIFPAIAVANEIKENFADENIKATILFVGSLYGKEKTLCEKNNIPFYGLQVRGIKGRGIKAISASFNMLKAIYESYCFLGKNKTDAVIGFGGYACFAMLLAAKLRGIPTMIHEQNAVAGLANKILAKFVQTICLTLKDTKNQFDPKKTVITGNPIRKEIAQIQKDPHTEKHLLIMGGSLGAVALNSLVVTLLSTFKENNISFTHQCGEKDYQRVYEAYKSHGYTHEEIEKILFPFIDNMAELYKKTDLALCRAGATSIAELTATKTPAIFIPFPYAANDHQTANAQTLVDEKAAYMVQEKELKNFPMAKVILKLLNDDKELAEMAENMGKLAHKNAAQNVVNELKKIIKY